MRNMEIIKLGNTTDKPTQSRSVYHIGGVSPTLLSGMSHGNTVPYIVEGVKYGRNKNR